MKRLLFAVLACLSTWPAQAQKQQSGELTEFKNYTTLIENQRQALFRNKNYPLAEKIIKEWIGKYNSSVPALRKNFINYPPSMYYNLACCVNLQGRGDEALSYLEKSVKLGFAKYA